MTAPALTAQQSFEYRTGCRSMLKRKHLREREKLPVRAFAGIQVFENFISVKGKPFVKRKRFIKADGNGCHHNPEKLKALVERSPYDDESGHLDSERVQSVQGKRFDSYGNKIRTNAQYKAANKAKLYYKNPKILPFIDVARKSLNRLKGRSTIGMHRSEGREATSCTLEVLFLNMDVHSLRVGRPDVANKKLFHYPKNSTLAAQSGLHPRRFQRQLELLEASGVIGMSRRYEKLETGEYVGKASAIWFERDFMKAFGMLNTFNRTSAQLTAREKRNDKHGVKTEEQIKAEAIDKLCRAAGQIVSKKRVNRDINKLRAFLDADESPPDTKH